MKSKLMLIPIISSALPIVGASALTIVSVINEQPEPEEYIEVELTPWYIEDEYRSQKISLEKGKGYKFVGNLTWRTGVDNFYFCDALRTYEYYVDVNVISFTFKDQPVKYEIEKSKDEYWTLHSNKSISQGNFEIKLTVNKTINNVYAWFTG